MFPFLVYLFLFLLFNLTSNVVFSELLQVGLDTVADLFGGVKLGGRRCRDAYCS